ncbi:mechanosensitive ion channel family protein [Planococcus maritimus]|nr:mechanosensitive ion channel family protein [Planococcus maritimus]
MFFERSVVERFVNQMVTKLLDEEMWVDISGTALRVLLIAVGAYLLTRVMRVIIRKSFSVQLRGPIKTNGRRHQTLSKLVENIATYVIGFMAVVAILSVFSINVSGIIAGAGVIGLAVGFGAQNLVRDVITGFFIIFEDQFSVGDYVRINQAEGTVQEIGLRTTKVQAWTGELFIFPNGTVTEVVNFSLHNSTAVVDLSVSHDSDLAKVERLILEFLETVQPTYEEVISPAELLGVQNMTATEVVMRLTAETLPMQHFAVSRRMRRDLKEFLDQRGVELPYPRMVVMHRDPGDPVSSNANK